MFSYGSRTFWKTKFDSWARKPKIRSSRAMVQVIPSCFVASFACLLGFRILTIVLMDGQLFSAIWSLSSCFVIEEAKISDKKVCRRLLLDCLPCLLVVLIACLCFFLFFCIIFCRGFHDFYFDACAGLSSDSSQVFPGFPHRFRPRFVIEDTRILF